MDNMNNILNRLGKSKFRTSFRLKEIDIDYIDKKGLDTIREHAFLFVEKRLSKSFIVNDGKQTPMKGHPVFIAQHATATCCRKCLYKWHHITPNHNLTDKEKGYIVNIIMYWINEQYFNNKKKFKS